MTTSMGRHVDSSGRHVDSSGRHVDSRAKTSCWAPAQSRSPSAHRSRSVSQALRQAGSPVRGEGGDNAFQIILPQYHLYYF